METRTLFGLQMEQKRNDAVINKEVFENVVTQRKEVGGIHETSLDLLEQLMQ